MEMEEKRHAAGTLGVGWGGEQRLCHLLQTINPQESQRLWCAKNLGFQIHKQQKYSGCEGRISNLRLRQEMLYFGGQERVYDISHYGVPRPRDHLSRNYGSPPQVMRMNGSYNCCPGLVAFNTVSLLIQLRGNFHGHGKRELGDESLRRGQWGCR